MLVVDLTLDDDRTVHALWQGLAICRFHLGAPAEWPEGHVWVSPLDLPYITCAVCLRLAKQYEGTFK